MSSEKSQIKQKKKARTEKVDSANDDTSSDLGEVTGKVDSNDQAKAEAKLLKKQARVDLVERLERRTALAEQRIAQAEAQATSDVKAAAAELAAAAAEHLLKSGLKKTDLNNLISIVLEYTKP